MNNTIDNTKLAGVLKTFDKADRLAAKRFLGSSYFNSSQELVSLFLEILKLQEKNRPLDKVKLWKKISGNKTYSDLRFRKYCSDLSKLMERFLAQQAFDEDEVQQKIFLLKRINQQEQKAEKLANSTINSVAKFMESYPFRDSSYFLNQFLLHKNFYDYHDYDTKRGAQSNLNEISEYLDLMYFSEKLRISSEAIQRKNFKVADYNSAFTEELEQHVIQAQLLERSPAVSLYYQSHKMWTDVDNEEHYFKLKSLIQSSAILFPPKKAINDFYTTAQNYCVKKINSGERQFLNELFELFKMQIDQKLLLTDGKLNPWYFRNIIVVALRLGEYDWVEDFINRFKTELPDSHKENAVTYNMAQLYFYQKQYDKVLEQLRFVEYDDMSYNLNSKVMLMLTYYELDEFDLLDSHLDSFEVFLKRRKDFTADRKQIYIWLIKYTRRLTRIIPGDKKALQKLKEDIQSTKGVVNANWLLQKIEEME
ncbi:MAG: hypothetical protein AAFZ63_27080 [Bacteroidota bacterium]